MKNSHKEYNNDSRKMIKRFLVYIACFFVVFIVTSTLFTILKIQTWAIILFNVVFGAGMVLVCEIIYRKKERKKQVQKLMSDKPDTFA